jgi:uncharacterized membrane protein
MLTFTFSSTLSLSLFIVHLLVSSFMEIDARLPWLFKLLNKKEVWQELLNISGLQHYHK